MELITLKTLNKIANVEGFLCFKIWKSLDFLIKNLFKKLV